MKKTKEEWFKQAEITVVAEPLPEPENKEEYEACNKNPITHDCVNCWWVAYCNSENYLTLTANIPKRIIDFYWPILRHNEKDILIFLANRANFAKDNKQFGVAYATKKQISIGTSVPLSNIHLYIIGLVRHGLITKYVKDPKLDVVTNSWYTNTQFVVTWFRKMEDIKLKIKEIEMQSKQ